MSEAIPELPLGDSAVASYTRSFDTLTVTFNLWNETVGTLTATGVTTLHDTGTWECDGLVRFEELDSGDARGFAIVDTDGNATLRFASQSLEFADSTGTTATI